MLKAGIREIDRLTRLSQTLEQGVAGNKHTIWLKVNSLWPSFLLSSIGGQAPASSFPVPSLAVRYGLLFQRDPSYSFGFGQVGRGAMFVRGLTHSSSQKRGRHLPARLM